MRARTWSQNFRQRHLEVAPEVTFAVRAQTFNKPVVKKKRSSIFLIKNWTNANLLQMKYKTWIGTGIQATHSDLER